MLPLDVAPVIVEFNVGPLAVERRSAPTQNAFGGRDSAAPVPIVLDPVSAHNLTGRDLDRVPEAGRNSEVVQFYTFVRLFVADGGNAADVVLHRSRRYRIVKVRDFEVQGGVYCAFGALEDVQVP